MDGFDAGTLDGVPVSFDTTVYGPVQGTVTVRGKPYAITMRRSTYAQDGLALAALRDMTLGRARRPANFFRAANEFGFTFNWVYANRRRTAYFSSGLLPRRPPRSKVPTCRRFRFHRSRRRPSRYCPGLAGSGSAVSTLKRNSGATNRLVSASFRPA